jgi:hypothetical protein
MSTVTEQINQDKILRERMLRLLENAIRRGKFKTAAMWLQSLETLHKKMEAPQ